MNPEQEAAAATVTRLHGPELANVLAEFYPNALPLVADGWTVDAALNHVTKHCDWRYCTGEHL